MLDTSDYASTMGPEHIRRFGQHFTPKAIADFMVSWALEYDPVSVLDPALGNSIFARTATEQGKHSRFRGYDIDPTIVEHFGVPSNVEMSIRNYLLSDWDDSYEAIVGNPPYLRFQLLPDRPQIRRAFEENLGSVPSGLSNSYLWFTLKCLHQLKSGGRMAFIVPPDFLDLTTGSVLRDYCLEHGVLEAVISLDHLPSPVFKSALTNACILLFSRKANQSVRFWRPRQIEELKMSEFVRGDVRSTYVSYRELAIRDKWGELARGASTVGSAGASSASLSDFCRVKRGLATGANAFFLLNREKMAEFGFEEQDVVQVLPKSFPHLTNVLTREDFEDLSASGQSVYLFCPATQMSESASRYIAYGESEGIADLALPSKRKPWFSRENVAPAPILIGQAGRKGVRVIRNRATNVIHLTAFHGVYPKAEWIEHADAIFAVLCSSHGQELLVRNAKVMATGLLKFQPRDLETAGFPNISLNTQKLATLNKLGAELSSKEFDSAAVISKINKLVDLLD